MEEIEIIYEDEAIVALNKPAGLLVHPDGSSEGPFLTDWVLAHYPQTQGVGEKMVLRTGEEIVRPGIVHRLDKETSGVLLIAKTPEAHAHLKEEFQSRKVEKIYNAYVYGTIIEDEGVIDRAIGKSRSNFKLWSAQRGMRGKVREALTEFRVLRRGKDKETGEAACFLEVHPRTGRTHQIRVHLKAIHHPVVCDSLYAPKRPQILGFSRLALHAHSITFKTLSGTAVTATAPLPEDFVRAGSELTELLS